MVHDEKLQGIIDWVGARTSFAEEDFCSIEHGEWTTESYTKKALLAGYASVRPVPDYALFVPFLHLSIFK